jgi:polyhydroxybutyrate depolymerase
VVPRRAEPLELASARVRRDRRGAAALACAAVLVAAGFTSAAPRAGGSPPRSAGCGQPQVAGNSVHTVASAGAIRSYRLAVPSGSGPFGLILNFHGLGSNDDQQAIYSQLEQAGPARGYVVATPQGTGNPAYWNIEPQLLGSTPDDVAYTSTLIDHLEATECVNPERVYSTGISNGAGLSALLGCAITSRLAAIAPVAGLNLVAPCPKGIPLSVLAFHGTSDPLVPYTGGTLGRQLSALSAPQSVMGAAAVWAKRDRCGKATTKPVGSEVTLTSYGRCAAGTAVELYSVLGGGHTWPGAQFDLPPLGFTTHEIRATDLILAFFDQHQRRP